MSDWVWVTKDSLQLNKHCVIALVIMTKLISDQLPSSLAREEGGFIQGHSGESERNTRGAGESHATSISVPCHRICFGGWALALAAVLPSVFNLWRKACSVACSRIL